MTESSDGGVSKSCGVARILVVDDEADIRLLLRDVLEQSRTVVVCVESAPDAIREMEARPFSLVVTDIGMPGMSGLDLLKWIKEHQPDTPVIVMTGLGPKSVDEAERLGACGHFAKPFVDIRNIRVAVERVLKGGSLPEGDE
jgi:DNA-binding NtrC family response regulator